jgi:hypothetical protein
MSDAKNSGRLPAFQFYPADWRKDPGVQSLDYETRGIWWEIICLLHESNERGVLLLNGNPMPEDALCRLLGLDNQKLTTALTTLLTYGVAKRRESDGALYSKRMVADENLRQIRKMAGSKGGNPLLLNQKPTTTVKQKPTPSSSSSSSNTPISPKPPAPPSLVLEVQESKPSLTPEQIEVGSWFNRRPTTPWSEKELKTWAKIPKPIDPEDWQALRWFYTQSGCQYLRRDILTLLNNWTGEIDRAKNYNPDQK